MEEYGEILAAAGIVAYVVIGLFAVLFAWWGYRLFRRKGKENKGTDLPSDESFESVSAGVKGEGLKEGEGKKVTLGTGTVKCLCFRKIQGVNVADFTTIPEPIGELYQFDPSCPISGSGYIVREDEKGEIIDYDPREVKYVLDQSPEFAWLATNGDTVIKNFWQVMLPWWKSTSVWFAAAMMVIVFITSLAVLG